MTRSFLFVVLCFALLLPTSAEAVDGFANMKWGMTRADVRSVLGDRAILEPEPKSPPKDTSGAAIELRGAKFFSSDVNVRAYFGDSGLSVIRLKYKRERQENLDELLAFYEPRWGAPIKTVEREGSRKKRTYSWPWEGVEFRSVEDDGKLEYQRVDYSAEVIQDWRKADAVVCAMLPNGTGCAFPDTYCPQQDSSMPKGKKTQEVRLMRSKGQWSCVYEGYRVKDARMVFERPKEQSAKWLKAILQRRLGNGVTERRDATGEVREITDWRIHGVRLVLTRRATAKRKDGTWTGPIERVYMKRTHSKSD